MSNNIWKIIMIIIGIIAIIISYDEGGGIDGPGIKGIIFIIIGLYVILSKYFI